MEDKAYKYYKEITNNTYIQQFKDDCCLSGLTRNMYYEGPFTKRDLQFNDDAKVREHFEVTGQVYEERINCLLNIDYSFKKRECADKFLEVIKQVYPYSKIKILKRTWQEVRFYG
jgi:hypothetical protein